MPLEPSNVYHMVGAPWTFSYNEWSHQERRQDLTWSYREAFNLLSVQNRHFFFFFWQMLLKTMWGLLIMKYFRGRAHAQVELISVLLSSGHIDWSLDRHKVPPRSFSVFLPLIFKLKQKKDIPFFSSQRAARICAQGSYVFKVGLRGWCQQAEIQRQGMLSKPQWPRAREHVFFKA